MAAPIGNQFARRARIWRDAIDRALDRRSKGEGIKAIDELAEKLLTLCEQGDLQALKEFGDRVEGKAIQQTEISGDPDNPLQTVTRIELVDLDGNGTGPASA